MHGHPPSINFNNSPFSEKLGNTRIDPIGTLYECHLFMGFAILALLSFVNGDVENGYILFVFNFSDIGIPGQSSYKYHNR
jgi:hypothetical protein